MTNFRKNMNTFATLTELLMNNKATTITNDLKSVHRLIQKWINTSYYMIKNYQNKKRKMAPQLKKGDKIYLFIKNLKTQQLSKKLNHQKIRSFFIKQVKRSVNYELKLLLNMRIHSVFHISLLESADSETSMQTTLHNFKEYENEYEVEKILQQRSQKYLIKWKEYEKKENTWKSLKNLKECQKKLMKFQRENHLRLRNCHP